MNALGGIEGLLACTAIVAIFSGPYQRACEDFARDAIFERRETLFDLAASGELDFNSEQYRNVRSLFEDCIRFAHKVGISWVFIYKFLRKDVLSLPVPLQNLETVENPATRATVKRLIGEVAIICVLLLVLRNPLLLFLAIVTAVWMTVTKGMSSAKHWCFVWAEELGKFIQSEAANPITNH